MIIRDLNYLEIVDGDVKGGARAYAYSSSRVSSLGAEATSSAFAESSSGITSSDTTSEFLPSGTSATADAQADASLEEAQTSVNVELS